VDYGKLILVRRAFALAVCVLVAVACSDPGPHAPPLPSTYGSTPIGSDGTAGGDGGAGNGPAVSGTCPMGTYDFDTNSGFKGDTAIAGTVTFSAPIKAGHKIVMSLFQIEMGGGVSGFGTFETTFPDDRTTFTYRLTSIDASDYAIAAQGDVGGATDEPTDPGDMIGYYAGSATSPIQDQKQANLLTIPPCWDKVDFGAAPK
jgi:hypothetical protein